MNRRKVAKFIQFQLAALLLQGMFGCYIPPPDPAIEQQIESKLQQLLTQAVSHLRAGRLERAEGALELARELRPADPRILDGLGCLYFRRGDFAAAETMFRRAVANDPGYSRPYAHLAGIARRNGDYRAAADLLAAALTLNPLNHRARSNYSALLDPIDGEMSAAERAKADALNKR